ncbi:MAG: TRAP transporter substrate-binding protein DctP [Desulfamplus sp.]|nr:TRAP transporter substrate-binding protein DctP [Desulfamplus sp.]
MKTLNQKTSQNISRRDFLNIAKRFGTTSTLMAASSFGSYFAFALPSAFGSNTDNGDISSSFGGNISLAQLAQAAEDEQKLRTAKQARVNLIYGVGIGSNLEHINPTGILHFVRDLEERTDGEIRVEIIDQSKICSQLDCVKRVQEGTVDIYCSTTQNAAGVAPYFNVLDFPYMFPTRAAQHYFFYHQKSEVLFREPLLKHYGIRFLFTNCRLRQILLGKKWRDKPDISSIEELKGLKIRATASKLGKIALELLNIKPIPIAWEEVAGALKHEMVDGIESYSSAVAAEIPDNIILPETVSQAVNLSLFSANDHTAMNENVFQRLTPELQNAVMESAYQTQMFTQLASEVAFFNTIGSTTPQKKDTIFGKYGIRFVELEKSELKKAEQICSPKFNPKPWEKQRERLNEMAGGIDVYEEIFNIAREIPADTLAENVEPSRWWRKI